MGVVEIIIGWRYEKLGFDESTIPRNNNDKKRQLTQTKSQVLLTLLISTFSSFQSSCWDTLSCWRACMYCVG
jgi:hypothetical protein